jgi:hypothetical protein
MPIKDIPIEWPQMKLTLPIQMDQRILQAKMTPKSIGKSIDHLRFVEKEIVISYQSKVEAVPS